jgi:hypothetical protein
MSLSCCGIVEQVCHTGNIFDDDQAELQRDISSIARKSLKIKHAKCFYVVNITHCSYTGGPWLKSLLEYRLSLVVFLSLS